MIDPTRSGRTAKRALSIPNRSTLDTTTCCSALPACVAGTNTFCVFPFNTLKSHTSPYCVQSAVLSTRFCGESTKARMQLGGEVQRRVALGAGSIASVFGASQVDAGTSASIV